MRISALLQRVLIFLFVFFNAAGAHAGILPQTFLSFSSDSGDAIGLGKDYFFAGSPARFVVNTSASPISMIDFFCEPDFGKPWSGGFFYSGASDTPLAVGQYDDARWYDPVNSGHPALSIYAENRVSTHPTGWFHIYDLTFDAIGQVSSLAVTFEQHNDGSAAALRGAFWYHSLAELPVSVPEPASYMVMLAGLGLLGLNRRKNWMSRAK